MTQPEDPIVPDPVDPDELTRSVPAPDAAAPSAPLTPTDPAPVAPAPPPGPIVSWAPSGSDPAAPGLPGSIAAGAATSAGIGGDVIATTWPRLIAYWLDALLVNIIPVALSFLIIDWEAMFRAGLESAQNPATPVPVTDMGLEGALLAFIGVAIGYVYFVGLWTSGGRATIGMRGLRMRVVDAHSGGTLSIIEASKRWLALGGPLPLLGLIGPLASIAGLASAGLALVLLISTASDSRRQGLHDKWAGSLVTRSPSSGAGATVVGCLVLLVASAAVTVLLWAALLAQLLPIIEDYLV